VARTTVALATPLDDVNRHSAGFNTTGDELVFVSEAEGIPNVESLRLRDNVITRRTRVLGSVYSPVALPGGRVLFLSEYAGGSDLQRVDSTARVPDGSATVRWPTTVMPVVPVPRVTAMSLPEASVSAPTVYRAGPRTTRFLAQGALGRDGLLHGAVISNADPANRLIVTATALLGSRATWRGGVVSGAWYGSRPSLRGEAFWVEHRPSRQWDAARVSTLDSRLAGASIAAELPVNGTAGSQRATVSAFVGAQEQALVASAFRSTLSASYGATIVTGWRKSAGLTGRVTVGTLRDSSFLRASAGINATAFHTRVDARWHRASDATPAWEAFTVGGFTPPLSDDATLSQRIAIPALPVGVVRGPNVVELRASRPMWVLPGTLYAHAVGASWRVSDHTSLLGLEQAFDINNLGVVGLPRLRALLGTAFVLRGPLRHKGSAYLALNWRP
jgi:hypothetical protein